MKTLKKTLCLVLVLVMSLSLVTVAGAEYTDVAEDNPYAEAIEVMSAIKVLDGMSEDTFEPEGTLTRAQAAKIVTYMLLGKDVAEDLPNDTKPFEDVESGFWAAGSIAYLKEVGAVSGKTAKIFDPQAKVTGYEFGKMVLEAAGIEGEYTGAAWTINVVRDMNQKGLLANLDDVKLSEDLTRGAAAQMAFNALNYSEKATITDYVYTIKAGSSTLSDTNVQEARLKSLINTSYSTYAEAVENANAAWSGTSDPEIGTLYTVSRDAVTVTPESLGNTVFGLSKATITDDNFGRPMTHYTATKPSTTLNFPVKANFTYEGKVSQKTLAADLGNTALKYTFTNYVNGVSSSGTAPTKTSTAAYNGTTTGDATEVYVDAGAKTVTVVTVKTYIGEVGRVTAATDDAKRFVTLKGGKTFTTESFKVGDVVLYTESNKMVGTPAARAGIQTMQLASTVTGTLTKIVTVSGVATYTVDGKEYTVNPEGKTSLGTGNVGKEVSFYVDTQGNIMQDITAGSAAVNYINVLAHGKAQLSGNYIQGGGIYTVEIYGVTPDGQVATYTAQGNGSTTVIDAWVANSANAGLYSYTVDPATGNLVLTLVSEPTVNANIGIGQTTVSYGSSKTAILNSDTKFVFVKTKSATDKTVASVTVQTGNANIGNTITAANAKIAVENGVAKVVFVVGEYTDPTTDSGLKVLVDASTKETVQTVVDGSITQVFQYTGYTSDMQTVTVTSTTVNISADAVYNLNNDNSLGSPASGSDTEAEVTAINGSTVTIKKGGSTANLNLTSDTVIYGLSDDAEVMVGQQVAYVTGAANTVKANDITVIWITTDQSTYSLTLTKSSMTTYDVAVNKVTIIGGSDKVENEVVVTVTKADKSAFAAGTYTLSTVVVANTDGTGDAPTATVKDQSTGVVVTGTTTYSISFTVSIKSVSENTTLTLSDANISYTA